MMQKQESSSVEILTEEKFRIFCHRTDIPNRLYALKWEKENALRLWNEGNSMSLHKRPRPWEG